MINNRTFNNILRNTCDPVTIYSARRTEIPRLLEVLAARCPDYKDDNKKKLVADLKAYIAKRKDYLTVKAYRDSD